MCIYVYNVAFQGLKKFLVWAYKIIKLFLLTKLDWIYDWNKIQSHKKKNFKDLFFIVFIVYLLFII